MSDRPHPYLKDLQQQFAEGRVGRREFLRTSTLLGLSATSAYALAGKVTGESIVRPAQAALPKGGDLRIGMPVQEVKNPHTFSFAERSNISRGVCEYLAKTGQDNVTRPYLLESWQPSDDLKTWTLNVRKGVKWHKGREFTADDVVWNIKHCLDPSTGSSVLGLMKGYMIEEVDTGEKDEDGNPKMSEQLWDANAIEKVDSHTVRLNCKVPQVAVPEHFFHYPFPMLDPEEGGEFGAGSNGTGPFELVEHGVGDKAILKARSDYWGDGPSLDSLTYVDLGADASAALAALASQQVHGVFILNAQQVDVAKNLPHVTIYQTVTAETAVARGKCNKPPFDNPLVRKALRLATDQQPVVDGALRGAGQTAEHHHVCAIHPDYADLPSFKRDPEAARKLLAEAGHPNGLDVKIHISNDPSWLLPAAQIMVEQWKEAGFRVEIEVMPGATYWDVWDKVPLGYTNWYHRPLGFMALALAYRTGVPWNESSYSNAEFDKLLTEAEGIVDVEKRREVMAQLQKIMQEDGPITQPMWKSVVTAYDKRVKGFQLHPTNYIFGEELGLEA